MPQSNRPVFRKEALERLSSPERLDQVVRIVRPHDWLLLATLALLVGAALYWSVTGRLPTTVNGQGIIIQPRTVFHFQAPATGRLVSLALRVGDSVRKGDIIGIIDQADIRRQVIEEQRQLDNLLTQDREKSGVEQNQVRLLLQNLEAQRNFFDLQRQNREKNIRDAEAIAPVLQKRLDSLNALKDQGLIPAVSDDLLLAEKEQLENQARMSDLRAQLREIDSQLKQLEIRERELAQRNLEAGSTRRNEIQRARGTIAVLETQLERNGRILSEHSGRVLELSATAGDVVTTGGRLGSITVQDESVELVCQAYFAVSDGKRIQPGMRVQVVPDTVKRERFGGVVGIVRAVSPLPVTREGAAAVLGSQEVVARLLSESPCIEIIVDLERDPSTHSGFRWTSSRGPQLQISPGTTTANRVTVEERAPISYLLPFLRSVSGIY